MKKLVKSAIITLSISLTANALMIFFHMLATRTLSVSNYGNLSTVMILTTILFVSSNAISTEVTRRISKGKKEKLKDYFWTVIELSRKVMFGILILSFLIYIFWSKELGIGFALASLFAPGIYIFALLKGYFQSKEDKKNLAVLLISANAFAPILLYIFVKLGLGFYGGVIAIWMSAFLSDLIYAKLYFGKGEKVKLKINEVMITNLIIVFLSGLDLLYVRILLGAEPTGIYNAAALMVKILFLGVDGLVMTILPKASKYNLGQKEKFGELFLTSITILTIGLLFFVFFPEQLMSLFFPPEYLAGVPVMKNLSIGMFSLGMTVVTFNMFWSQHLEKDTLKLISGTLIAQSVILYFFTKSWGIVGASASSALVFSSLAVVSIYLLNKRSEEFVKSSLT